MDHRLLHLLGMRLGPSHLPDLGVVVVRRLILVTAVAVGLAIGAATHAGSEPEIRCTEDMSCWDCETMGNRICGP